MKFLFTYYVICSESPLISCTRIVRAPNNICVAHSECMSACGLPISAVTGSMR